MHLGIHTAMGTIDGMKFNPKSVRIVVIIRILCRIEQSIKQFGEIHPYATRSSAAHFGAGIIDIYVQNGRFSSLSSGIPITVKIEGT